VDPFAWFQDVLTRVGECSIHQIDELLTKVLGLRHDCAAYLLTLANLFAAWRASSAVRGWWLAAGLAALLDRVLTFSYSFQRPSRASVHSAVARGSLTAWYSVFATEIVDAFDLGGWFPPQDQSSSMEMLFRAVFEQATDVMLIADDDARFLDVNTAGCALLGLSRDEVLNLSMNDITERDHGTDTGQAWRRLLAEGAQLGIIRLRLPNGNAKAMITPPRPTSCRARHLLILREPGGRKGSCRAETSGSKRYLNR